MGAGGLREEGEEWPGAGRSGKNFATLAQYFALGEAHGGGNRYGRGRESGVQGAGGGKFRPPGSPPPPQQVGEGETVSQFTELWCCYFSSVLTFESVPEIIKCK